MFSTIPLKTTIALTVAKDKGKTRSYRKKSNTLHGSSSAAYTIKKKVKFKSEYFGTTEKAVLRPISFKRTGKIRLKEMIVLS